MTIPIRERGYAIEPNTAIVHERYQDHAPAAVRTSARGVTNIANGRKPVPCPTCFGVKPKREPAPRVGMTPFIAEMVEETKAE